MSSEMVKSPVIPGFLPWRWITSSRFSLRMTAAERKVILVCMDLLLINGSLLGAVSLWNGFVPSVPNVLAYAKWFVTLSVVWLWLGAVLDIYNLARSASVNSVIVSVGLASLLTGAIYLLIPWLTPPVSARHYVFGFLALDVSVLVTWRVLYAKSFNQLVFQRRALILGTNSTAQTLMRDLNQAGQTGYASPFRGTGCQVIGLVSAGLTQSLAAGAEPPTLGSLRHLVRLAHLHQVDEIIVALDNDGALPPEVYEVLLDCRELGLRVSSVTEIYERLTARLPVEYARCDLQAILDQTDRLSIRLYLAIKGLIDLTLALIGSAALALVTPWVALGNAIWSPGPLLYRQERVGKGGRPFAVYKFRSMVTNAEQASGAVWSGDDDPRITPVGRWLRKTRLDELPQVINVLRGDMSIVGPRPERPHFVGQLVHELPLYRVRNAVKPGITGWAQIRYRYGNSVEDSRIKLEYDLYYIKHADLFLDVLIILQTMPVMLRLQGK